MKTLKRAMALIFVFMLSINSFAAIVSDNDGSAFVTKAEFEALKDSFATQIKNYENSLTGKIDGAIASYLAGINVKKAKVSSLLLTADDGYWFYGKRPEQTYGVPGIHYMLSMHGAGHSTGYWNTWASCYGCTLIAKTNSSEMTKNIVTLAEGKEEYGSLDARNKWLWNGVNPKWKEKIVYAKQVYNRYQDVSNAESIVGMNVYSAYEWNIADGYHSDADIANLWKTCVNNQLWYIWSTSSANLTGNNRNGYLNWSASYDSTKTTKKIVCSVKNNNWNAVCNTLTNTWNTDVEQTLKGDAIEAAATGSTYDGSLLKVGNSAERDIGTTYTGVDIYIEKHCDAGSLTGEVYSSAKDGSESSAKIPSVCSLGYIPSGNLYMFITKKTFETGTVENVKLTDGIPLFYAKNGEKVTWRVKVNDVSGDASSGVSSTDEVDIALGYGKFDNSGYDNSNGYVDSTDTEKKTTTISWFTTSSQAKKITFTMAEDAWIYLKVKPHSLTKAQAEASRVWTVNLSNSDTYGQVEITQAD